MSGFQIPGPPVPIEPITPVTLPGTPTPPVGTPITPQPIEPVPLAPSPPVTPPTEPISEPLAPVEPEPGVPQTLPELGKLALLILILAFIALAKAFTDFLNWLFQRVLGPLFPKTSGTPLDPTEVTQSLSNALGATAQSIDGEIGASFSKMAQTTNRVGSTIVAVASSVYTVAAGLARLEASSGEAGKAAATASASAAQAQLTATHAAAAAAVTAKALPHAIEAVQTQNREAITHITHVIEPELDALRSRIHELEKGATSSWDLLTQHGEALGIDAMTATAGIALAKLGGSWIECEAAKMLGKAACSSGAGTIKNLLEGLLDIGALFELCELTKLLETAADASPVQDLLHELIGGIDDLIKCRQLTLKTPLKQTAYVALAPPTAWAELSPVG